MWSITSIFSKGAFVKLFILALLAPITALAETSYQKDALPIFQSKCAQCHNASNMADKNWLDYGIARSKKDRILDRVWTKKDMPPYGNVTNITDQERETLKNWVEQGAQK